MAIRLVYRTNKQQQQKNTLHILIKYLLYGYWYSNVNKSDPRMFGFKFEI